MSASTYPASALAEYGWPAVPRDFDALLANIGPARTVGFDELLPLPDTKLAREVDAFAKKALPGGVYNHSVRVYLFGRAILLQHFPTWKLTPETLFLTSLLHDLGCTPGNLRATLLSFEFYGAYQALELLRAHHTPTPQAEAVAETIIRHQDLGTTGVVTQLTAIILLATVLDNAGKNAQVVTEETIAAVAGRYPRNGWTRCFADTIGEEMELKPWAHSSAIEGFQGMILGNELMAPYDT